MSDLQSYIEYICMSKGDSNLIHYFISYSLFMYI